MNKLWVTGILFAFGCSKDITKDMEDLADRMCACKDNACATKVMDDLTSFAEKNKDGHGDEERAKKAALKLAECALKAGVDPSQMLKLGK
jgi:hypothetical protein